MSRKPAKRQQVTIEKFFLELGRLFNPDYTRKSLEELKMAIEKLQKLGFEKYEVESRFGHAVIEFHAYITREETDEEFDARVRQWQLEQKRDRERRKAAANRQEEKERKEYERLKKKFDPD